jgi:hypothetical protein
MSALFAALDAMNEDSKYDLITGENGHIQQSWSRDIEDGIVQFDFQCVRTDVNGIDNLAKILAGMLSVLKKKQTDEGLEVKRKQLLTVLFKIIAKTRDINGGKGEYMLAYMMLFIWHHDFPEVVEKALSLFVLNPKDVDPSYEDQEPYGSWKDIKYLSKLVYDKTGAIDHPLIKFCVKLINKSLRADVATYDSTDEKKALSLVSKWIARESSGKFGFLYDALAKDYFPEYMATARSNESIRKATLKCKAQYRMICSKLNRHLDTVQIKQTAKNWAAIDHSKTTSITMAKNRKAFLNLQGSGARVHHEQRSEDPDRIQCAENLRTYLETLKKEGKEVKGKNVGLDTFTKQANSIIRYNHFNGYEAVNQDEADILNSQWRDNGNKKNANGLGNMVAIVDTSGSMSGDPLNAAIALGCRVAEKSILGKRIMTFSANPTWINLDNCETFTSMVAEIHSKGQGFGLNTDFYKALDMILSAIEEKRIPPDEVENMILAIFSDMQIDDNLSVTNGGDYNPNEEQRIAARTYWNTMFDNINHKYIQVGMRLYGVPLNPPHILFWNLRNTNGFPAMTNEANCSMMSGYDPAILDMFCELGMDALKDMTPYKNLIRQLDNPRYLPMERIAQSDF